MQTVKSLSPEASSAMMARSVPPSAATLARRAKRIAALDQLAPQIEAMSRESKEAGLGLIGYFLDMALFEVKREQDVFAQKP